MHDNPYASPQPVPRAKPIVEGPTHPLKVRLVGMINPFWIIPLYGSLWFTDISIRLPVIGKEWSLILMSLFMGWVCVLGVLVAFDKTRIYEDRLESKRLFPKRVHFEEIAYVVGVTTNLIKIVKKDGRIVDILGFNSELQEAFLELQRRFPPPVV